MTFTPGDRVQWITKDLSGTVVPDEKCKEWPGFLAIQWDNGDRTLSAPTHLKTAKSGDEPSKAIVTAEETNNQQGAVS